MRFNERFLFVRLPYGIAARGAWSMAMVKPAQADIVARARE